MRLQLPLALSIFASIHAQAQPTRTEPMSRQMQILYGSPSWNTDSTRVDSAFLVLRDKTTGHMMQIQLEETEPDSAQFKGTFSLALSEGQKAAAEVFIPPQDQRGSKDYSKTYEAIQNGSLKRKPVIWKTGEKGQSIIEVYDTLDQAEAAMKAYQEQLKLAAEMKKKALIKPIPNQSALAAAHQARHNEQLAKLAMEAARREGERVRLEQIERQKAAERERQSKALSEAQKKQREDQAGQLAHEADELYNNGDYKGAEQKFHQAVELDPANTSYYFKYGVALYRVQNFNEAIVILKLAKVDPKTEIERKYYIGLAQYRLGELEAATKVFSQVAASQDPVMAPSALFYNGVIYFTQEKYEASKKAFETVIDISKDAKLDDQAELYIDRIAQALTFQKMRAHRWNVTGIVGVMYDSNVLYAPDNSADQGAATNFADGRILSVGDLSYRPIFNEHHELQFEGNASLTNSFKNEASKADPWIYNVSLPYSYKGQLFGKGYRLTARPAYEVLYMAIDTNTKALSLSSSVMTLDNTFVMRNDWFSTYTLEYRRDDMQTADSVGLNDYDANKYALRTVQSLFLDKAKKEAILGNVGYVINSAKGQNKIYNRIEFGAMYVRPMTWNAAWNLGLNVYTLDYSKAEQTRNDLNVTLTAGLSKPIRQWVTWGVVANYTKNNSNIAEYAYSKYTVMTTATFTTDF